MLQRPFDELKLTGCLPSPTGVGVAVLRQTQGDDFVLGELARTIQSDPALSARILKLANSTVRPGLEPVRTVEQAALRLGVRAVRSLALGFTLVSNSRTGDCAEFDYGAYWSRTLARAVAAQAIARKQRPSVSEEAFTCALLARIGQLALASIHPEAYSRVLGDARGKPVEILLAEERRALGLDHAELSAAMMRDWHLPESYAFAAIATAESALEASSDEARFLAEVLRWADRFAVELVAASQNASGEWGRRASDLEAVRRELALDAEPFERLRNEISADWREWSKVFAVPSGATPKAETSEPRGASEPDARKDPAATVAGERKGLRVLAVDDDAVSLRLLSHLLSRDGHTVMKASDGREALALALEHRPQVVVTDWIMPEMSGLELCKALRSSQEGRGTYILIVTGREEEERVVEAFEAGADEYVSKPFKPRILAARVRAGQRMIELREQVELDKRELDRHITEMRVLNRKLSTAAMTDVLTELPNRRYAMRQLEEEVAAALLSNTPLSAIMIDIDHFKSVNDRYGHGIGDIVLRETAAVLRRGTRKNEVVCRLGGEEFLVIAPGIGVEACAVFAERLRHAVEHNRIAVDGFDGHVTASLGVATLGPGVGSVDELLKTADRRVYIAKSAGRNRVCSRGGDSTQIQSA
jgi:diguanylate cyclase (GGDEF)-like protein